MPESTLSQGPVTVRSFWSLDEAYWAKSLLEDEEIPSFLANEVMAGMYIYSNAIGGAELQVRKEDVERAKDILDHDAELQANHEDESANPTDGTEPPVEESQIGRQADESRAQVNSPDREEEETETYVLSYFRHLKRPIIWLYLAPTVLGIVWAVVLTCTNILRIAGNALDLVYHPSRY